MPEARDTTMQLHRENLPQRAFRQGQQGGAAGRRRRRWRQPDRVLMRVDAGQLRKAVSQAAGAANFDLRFTS